MSRRRRLRPTPPAPYLAEVVIPTLWEYLDAPVDQRRAYLSCITTAHLIDHVARHDRAPGKARVRAAIIADGTFSARALAIVEGICNGTKHAGTDANSSFQFRIGELTARDAFGFDTPGSGFGEGRWDAPGLTAEHQGATSFIDDCVRGLIWAFLRVFPEAFGDFDVSATRPKLSRWMVPNEADEAGAIGESP